MEKEVISKIPPNDIIAEQAVLGSMLADKDAAIKAIEVLKPDDFYREDHKAIYKSMVELFGVGEPIDYLTIRNSLDQKGMLEKIGSDAYLSTLIDSVPTTSNIESYVKIVEEKSILRSLIKAANDILAMGYDSAEEVN